MFLVLLYTEHALFKKLIMVGKKSIMKRKWVQNRIFPHSLGFVLRHYISEAELQLRELVTTNSNPVLVCIIFYWPLWDTISFLLSTDKNSNVLCRVHKQQHIKANVKLESSKNCPVSSANEGKFGQGFYNQRQNLEV